jgi:hypothetical protein
MHAWKISFTLLFVAVVFSSNTFGQGGPPLIGDDPGTPGNGKWEINVAYPLIRTEDATTMDLGYLDINYGLGDHVQINYQGGVLLGRTNGQGWHGGYDNSLVGFKWRFLDQENNGVDMSFYPQLGFNTTSSLGRLGFANSGLGAFIPFEIAWTKDKWELDGEIGYQYQQHDRDQWAGGLILGYLLNDKVELLAEARMVCDPDFRSNNLILDGGARVNLVEHVQLLFAVGKGLRNDGDSPHFYLYAGLGFKF